MRPLSLTLLLVLTAGALSQPVGAGTMFSGDQEIETKYRTKIMKEKAKQATESIQNQRQNYNNDSNQSNADCGSQNIGNVDTGGRAGNQPREIFVFAPNSINVVGSRACN